MTNHKPEAVPNTVASNGIGRRSAETTCPSVLVVSPDIALKSTVETALNEANKLASVSWVEGCMMALGHMGSVGSGEMPQVLISRIECLDGDTSAVVSAFHRLSPQTRLLLLTSPEKEEEANRAISDGFDQYLVEPIDPYELAKSLSSPSRDDSRNLSPLVRSLFSEVKNRVLVEEGFGVGEGTGEASEPQILGVIDLIDHLLLGDSSIVRPALKLMSAHSQVAQLDWHVTADEVPKGDVAVEVAMGSRTYGWLHAPEPVAQKTLQRWSGWLVRWLQLEQRINRLWHLALHDELTGVWNRRYLHGFLDRILSIATRERFCVTVLVFDIDDFKCYNDRFGHAAGDEILGEAARLMVSVVREHDVVARIGGDEFAVVFWDAEGPRRPNSEHPDTIRKVAHRFQQAICQHKFPKLEQAPGTLTISGGLAGFPWDGKTAKDLLAKADQMALRSKQQGKNVITFGPGTQ